MATPKGQRIGIWVIAIVLTVGTLGSFLVMGLSINNQKIDEAAAQKQYDDYQAKQKATAQANADNSEGFGGYSSRVFDASSVTKLNVEILKQGTGTKIKSSDTINASYFGWLPDGTIFDSSKKKNAADTTATFALDQVISGWTTGLTGVKVGSIVRLTIPSDEAYGANGSGIIPVNTPLEFIVEVHSIKNDSTTAA